jgi:hypothetical protein
MSDAAVVDPDATLRRRLEETTRMLAARKLRYVQVQAAGGDPPISDLAVITKLETQLTNLEHFLALRDRHRARRAAG